MFAVINYQGKQHVIEEGKLLYLDRIKKTIGSEIEIKDIPLVFKDEKIGLNSKISVSAEVYSHVLDKKINVIHFARRKRRMTKQGHRQQRTAILIKKISIN